MSKHPIKMISCCSYTAKLGAGFELKMSPRYVKVIHIAEEGPRLPVGILLLIMPQLSPIGGATLAILEVLGIGKGPWLKE
jgi:hypothetical protein